MSASILRPAAPAPRAADPWLAKPSAVAAVAAALSVLTAWYILWLYLPLFNTSRTSLVGVAHAPSQLPPTPGLARRVAVLFFDGLAFSAARSLEEIEPLRRIGVLRPLAVAFPSYTDPAITSLMTGLEPTDTGMRLNGHVTGVQGLDTFTAAAADAGVPVRIRTRGWEAFADHLRPRDASLMHGNVSFLAELYADLARGGSSLPPIDGRSPARAISFVYLGEADKAGHLHGAASPEYDEASHLAGSLVARYAASLDLEQDTLLVVSDHGHLAKGGHGGVEPEIMSAFLLTVGGFVRSGVELGERPMRDVASTLSVLAGVRVPSSNLGRPMLDMLKLDDEQRAFLLAAPFDEATRFVCKLSPSPRCADVEPLLARLRRADPEAWPIAEDLLDALYRDRRDSLAARAESAAATRLTIALAALAAGLLALFRRRRDTAVTVARLLLFPALHIALYCAALGLLGYTASFSAIVTQLAFYRDAAAASLLAVGITFVIVRITRPGPLAPWTLLGGTAAPIALLAAWLGLDSALVPPALEGIALLEIAPAMLSASVLAIALSIAARRPRPARDSSQRAAEP